MSIQLSVTVSRKVTPMSTIWKYELEIAPQQVSMPKGAKILSVANQDGEICLWALVDQHAPTEERSIEVIGTGWNLDKEHKSISSELTFIGTVLVGPYVWHVFERIIK